MLEWLETHQLPCLFRRFFEIECPGCGFQTALLLLLKGEAKAACLTWPGLLPLICFFLLIAGRSCGLKKITATMLKNVGIICLILILVSYLLKRTVY